MNLSTVNHFPITHTPAKGECLVYRDHKKGCVFCVRVLRTYAAACMVEILEGGLNNSLKGASLRVSFALLSKK